MWLTFAVLALLCWASVNIVDSSLVRRYPAHPIVFVWATTFFAFPLLFLIWLLMDVRTEWRETLVVAGFFETIGATLFVYAIQRLDISAVNLAWAMLAMLMSIAGFFFFHEVWTQTQTVAAILIFAGVAFFSFRHRKLGGGRSLFLLPALALAYFPLLVIQKTALFTESNAAVFFWPLLAHEGSCFVLPLFVPSYRRAITAFVRKTENLFYFLIGFEGLFYYGGTYLSLRAYGAGPASLVSVVANTQPFFVLLFAWILAAILPSFAPRELLTDQSIQVKLLSFTIVFLGLALLGASL
jgi:drug/metabolite transporter (DMT)-like permease